MTSSHSASAPKASVHAEHAAAQPAPNAPTAWLDAIGDAGFELIAAEPIAELDGAAYRLRHRASGAQLLYLQNADTDRAFAISFKTPPADDTGVFHILEHSVLCGSDKFPVKEPFVNLLKTSMQTFLNAMTFPDKTMYPVASTNEQDLLNLMDVYLDAVFHPAIYAKPETFEQEGWHLEVDKTATPPELTFNGVVYNEMKGALSEPDAVLWNALSRALFPTNAYRFESGGDPSSIIDLTHEEFLDSHRRHYRPDNAAIILYGALDIAPILAFLDEEYLSPLARAYAEKPADAPNPLTLQPPIIALDLDEPMVTAPENAEAAVGYVISTAEDRLRVIASDILFDAIMGSNESPLKRAILDANIGAETYATTGDSILQPFVAITLKGAHPDGAAALRKVIETTSRDLADGGLDHSLIEAAISHSEFQLREHDLGVSDGVAYAISVMASWLYDDADPCAYLRYEDAFATLRTRLNEGYFETLLRELVLENPHMASVNLVPVETLETDATAEALADAAEALGEGGFATVEAETERLRAAQEAPDTPEALATLPMLSVDDLGAGPADPPWHLDEKTPAPSLAHTLETHGILYMNRYYALEGFSRERLPLLTILSMVLGKLDTARHSAAELDTLTQSLLGSFNFFPEVFEDTRGGFDSLLTFTSAASSLADAAGPAAALVDEMLTETDFSDSERIRRILIQRKVGFEQALITAGHTIASRRAASYCIPAAALRESLEGLEFYEYLTDLIESFDERATTLTRDLAELAATIARQSPELVSLAGPERAQTAFWTAHGPASVPSGPFPWRFGGGAVDLGAREEGVIVPADVTFTALAYDRRLLDLAPNGLWSVASRVLSYDYLWNELRVKGGAYGCGFTVSRNGTMGFYTYRDPHLDESVERIARAGDWLARFAPTKAELDGYVISTTAAFDAPVKPRALMRRHDNEFLSCYDPALRKVRRGEVIDATVEGIRALGGGVSAVAAQRCLCTIGNRALLESSTLPLTQIDPFAGATAD